MAQFVLPSKNDPGATASGGKEYPLIPEYTPLNCEVVKVEIKEKKPENRFDADDLEEVSFHFKIVGGEFNGQRMFGNAKPIFNWNDKCRFRHWVEAIIGVQKDGLPEGFELDLPALTGKKVRVIAGVRKRKYDGKDVNYVMDVIPAEPSGTAAAVFN